MKTKARRIKEKKENANQIYKIIYRIFALLYVIVGVCDAIYKEDHTRWRHSPFH